MMMDSDEDSDVVGGYDSSDDEDYVPDGKVSYLSESRFCTVLRAAPRLLCSCVLRILIVCMLER